MIGATGYLGSRMAEYLAVNGHEVHAWGHHHKTQEREWSESFASVSYGDITGDETLHSIIEQSPEAIIYTVSLDHHRSEESISNAIQSNVLPAARLLQVLSDDLPSCRFIYFSTAQVYGSLSGTITEDDAPKPVNNYGLTHLMVDEAVRRYSAAGEIDATSVRISNGYGAPTFPDANCWWLVINDLCRSAIENSGIRLQSDGSPQRDFVHIRDINDAVMCVLDNRASVDGYVFNVGGGATYTILELANLVAEVFESRYTRRIPIRMPKGVTASPGRQGEKAERFRYDISRISNLGYAPVVSLEMGINEVFDYLDKEGSRK